MEAGQGRWRPPPARRIENLQRRHETSLVEAAATRLVYRPQPRTLVLPWDSDTLAAWHDWFVARAVTLPVGAGVIAFLRAVAVRAPVDRPGGRPKRSSEAGWRLFAA